MTDPSSPSSFGAWINHAANHHVGAISFLMVDFFLFFGVVVLTIVQASQVFSILRLVETLNLACSLCALLGFSIPSRYVIMESFL